MAGSSGAECPRKVDRVHRCFAGSGGLAGTLWMTPFLFAALVQLQGCAQPPLVPDDPRQPALLSESLGRVEAERPGIADVYFIGGALWASENVFLREATMARKVFDERFDTGGRSIVLANNHGTAATLPFATGPHLSEAILKVAARMDRNDDVLVVFLTTHGSADHKLLIDMGVKESRIGLSPTWLKNTLDRSRVKWRVIILSACYSGGFVDALANPFTLVVTAADSRHASFGCGDKRRLTYFGEGYIERSFQQTGSLVDAFPLALEWLRTQEIRERFDASNPQFVLGDRMREKLQLLEDRLKAARQAAR
jgi:hypothetical protein